MRMRMDGCGHTKPVLSRNGTKKKDWVLAIYLLKCCLVERREVEGRGAGGGRKLDSID
jgi:hypothetical protein